VRAKWPRALAAALLLLTLCAASSSAQGTAPAPKPPAPRREPTPLPGEPTLESALAGALLREADVPAGLRLQTEASGRIAVPGVSGHLVTFVHADAGQAPEFADLLDLPPGTILLVKNSVQLVTTEALVPGVLDSVIRGAEAAARAAGAVIDTTTDYEGLPVGDECRVHTMHYHLPGSPSASSALVAFRRGDVIAALNVEAAGDDPPFEHAMELAQIVDARLAAIVAPADAPPPAATPSPAPVTPTPPSAHVSHRPAAPVTLAVAPRVPTPGFTELTMPHQRGGDRRRRPLPSAQQPRSVPNPACRAGLLAPVHWPKQPAD